MNRDANRILDTLIEALDRLSANNATPSVKARSPKPFSIGTNFSAFLKQFENYATLSRIPEVAKKQSLLNLLDSSAFQAATLLNLNDTLTFEEFADKLTARFDRKDISEYKVIFRSCVQQPAESIPDYRDRIALAASKAYPNHDERLISELSKDVFLAGIKAPDSVREILFMRNPSDLESASRMASKLLSAHNAAHLTEMPQTPPVPKPRSKGTCNLVPPEQSGEDSSLLKAIKTLTSKVERLEAGFNSREDQPASSGLPSQKSFHNFRGSSEEESQTLSSAKQDQQRLNFHRGGKVGSFPPRVRFQNRQFFPSNQDASKQFHH
jgi:hypothetical protein